MLLHLDCHGQTLSREHGHLHLLDSAVAATTGPSTLAMKVWRPHLPHQKQRQHQQGQRQRQQQQQQKDRAQPTHPAAHHEIQSGGCQVKHQTKLFPFIRRPIQWNKSEYPIYNPQDQSLEEAADCSGRFVSSSSPPSSLVVLGPPQRILCLLASSLGQGKDSTRILGPLASDSDAIIWKDEEDC